MSTRISLDDLDHKIPGVRRVRYSLGQNFIKHDYRWCALVD